MVGLLVALSLLLLLGSVGWSIFRNRRSSLEPGVPFTGPHPARLPSGRRGRRLKVRPLRSSDRDRFIVAWHSTSARFVDDPAQAISESDRLLGDIMEARGLPTLDFDATAMELTIDHPHLLEHYRAARRIARQSEAGTANTEALHRGLAHYKHLIDDLLEVGKRPSASGF
jgi:hypothetical protein